MKLLDRLAALISRWGKVESANESVAKVDFEQLSDALQYRIQNKRLFSQALSHRSYLQLNDDDSLGSNERLEFLGDAILNLVVAQYLYNHHESAPEGDLTKNRSRLVNRKSLNVYAQQVHLDKFMLMGISAAQAQGRGMEKILADAFEALIAAVYLDGGYEASRKFIERHIHIAVQSGAVRTEDENFKSRLLEYAQAEEYGIPRYVTINEEGPDHDRTFTVEVYLGKEPYGVGMGKNKKDAEQAAAEKALQKIQLV